MISFTRPGKRYVAVQHVFRIRLPFPQNPRRLKNIWFEDKKHVFSWKVVNWGQLWRGHHQPCKLHAVHVLLRMKCVVSVHATQQVFKKWQTSRKMDRADRGTHHWWILCVSTVKIWKQQTQKQSITLWSFVSIWWFPFKVWSEGSTERAKAEWRAEKQEKTSSLRAWRATFTDPKVIRGPINHIEDRVPAQLAPPNSQGHESAYQLGTPKCTIILLGSWSWHGKKRKRKKLSWYYFKAPQETYFSVVK